MSLQMLECQNPSFLERMNVGIKQLVKSTAALAVVYLWGGEVMGVLTSALCAHPVAHYHHWVFMLTGDGCLSTLHSPSFL